LSSASQSGSSDAGNEDLDHRDSASLSTASVFRSNLKAIGVMTVAVALQVFGAVLLKAIADHRVDWRPAILGVGVAAVLGLNLVRLGVWGMAHRRFRLSSTVPLSSLFYPAMLFVALAYGDQIGIRQVLGAVLITSGTLWLSVKVAA